jgi:hypothetical protein
MVRRFRHPVNEADRPEARRAAEHWTKVKGGPRPRPVVIAVLYGPKQMLDKSERGCKTVPNQKERRNR